MNPSQQLALLPTWLLQLHVLAFGLIFGSFLNVVIHRLPRGESVVTPRSRCPKCGHLIRWYENIPVLSWLALRGRCRECQVSISWRYPAVELLTGLAAMAVFARFGMSGTALLGWLFTFAMLALVFIDLEHMILPDAITLPATFIGLVASWWSPLTTPASALAGVLVAILLIEGLNLTWMFWKGYHGLGQGDTKMLMVVGAFLGLQMVVLTLLVASFVGTLVGIPMLLLVRRRGASEGEDASTPEASVEPEAAEALEVADEPEHPGFAVILRDLAPRAPAHVLRPLAVLALAASFVSPFITPSQSLGGLLVGLVVMVAHDAWRRRSDPTPANPRGKLSHVWPLAGACLGWTPTWPTALVTLGALGAWGLFALLAKPLLPEEESDEDPCDLVEPTPHAPTLARASLPFGVCLGAGAIGALLQGQALVDWYLRMLGLTTP